MEIKELYSNLKEAYTAENLGRISVQIIDLFRDHEYDSLRAIQRVVSEYVPIDEEKINRIFSRLIMMYHPDRLSPSLAKLEQAYERGDFEELYTMSHILSIQSFEPGKFGTCDILTEEDLAEEFGWEGASDGYSYFMEEEEQKDDFQEEVDYADWSFLSALKRRVYGNLDVDFPLYLMEDLEEIEMADYELESLDGIESCRFARVVDLSNNNLTDITELSGLKRIERLYLSNNHIGLIDSLGNLEDLQVLDISYNDVDDLSPLFELPNLSYLSAMGNRIPDWQLERLRINGVTLVT